MIKRVLRYQIGMRQFRRVIGSGVMCPLGTGDEDGDPVCTKYKNKAEHVVQHRPNLQQMEIEL